MRKFYRLVFDDAKQGMIAAYATGDYTLQVIADTFNRDFPLAVHFQWKPLAQVIDCDDG